MATQRDLGQGNYAKASRVMLEKSIRRPFCIKSAMVPDEIMEIAKPR